MIADSSPLILFARAGRLDLLQRLFEEISIPSAVRDEVVVQAGQRPDAKQVDREIESGWIQVHDPSEGAVGTLASRHPNLGAGEKAAIALALDLEAGSLLMDDGSARRAAKLEGLRPVGCLGVLARAHGRGLVQDTTQLARLLRGLIDAGLWVSSDVVEAFWAHLGGRP